MKAYEARRLTDEAKSIRGEIFKKMTQEVLKNIEQAAKDGESSIYTMATNPIVQGHLTDLGYTVKYQSDPRDGDHLIVSW